MCNLKESAIRQARSGGTSNIAPRRYSPAFWTSAQRMTAYRYRPVLVAIFETSDECPRYFVAFGDREGAEAALDVYLGIVK